MKFFLYESKRNVWHWNPSTGELRTCGPVTSFLFHFYIAFALCNLVYMHNKGKREKSLSAFYFGLTPPPPTPIYEAFFVPANNK